MLGRANKLCMKATSPMFLPMIDRPVTDIATAKGLQASDKSAEPIKFARPAQLAAHLKQVLVAFSWAYRFSPVSLAACSFF